MFLDPSASHLIITTTLGENFYLHSQSRQPKSLSRLKGISIESIAWNPSQPTASTREILVGATDGNVYEVFIEPSSEFYRREERYCTQVWKIPEGAVTGLWTDAIPGKPDLRRVIIASHSRLSHWIGKIGGRGKEALLLSTQICSRRKPPLSMMVLEQCPQPLGLLLCRLSSWVSLVGKIRIAYLAGCTLKVYLLANCPPHQHLRH